MILVLAATGARFSQVTRMTVVDVHYWLRVFRSSGSEELVERVNSRKRGVTRSCGSILYKWISKSAFKERVESWPGSAIMKPIGREINPGRSAEG
jgi:hypothetical protein